MGRADEWSGAGMNGKGDKPRPICVSRQVYEDNWDRIFSKLLNPNDPIYENDNPVEGGPEMREHHCGVNGRHMVEAGCPCNWCGEYEDGTTD